jgi:hypothetical protein
MITKIAGLIGVIEVDELPIRGPWSVSIVQLHRITPDGKKILVKAFLERCCKLVERDPKVNGGLIDASDDDWSVLLGGMIHRILLSMLRLRTKPRDHCRGGKNLGLLAAHYL